jgi:hypothetical protein
MKNNQSLHLTIKQPPNPNPIKTLGIFDDLDNPNLPQVINSFIDGITFNPHSQEFEGNVKDEVLKVVAMYKPIAVLKQGNLTVVYFQ